MNTVISPREIHNCACAPFRYIYVSIYQNHRFPKKASIRSLASKSCSYRLCLSQVPSNVETLASAESCARLQESCRGKLGSVSRVVQSSHHPHHHPLPGPLISCAKHLNLPGSAHQSSDFTSLLITVAAAPGGRHDTQERWQQIHTPHNTAASIQHSHHTTVSGHQSLKRNDCEIFAHLH